MNLCESLIFVTNDYTSVTSNNTFYENRSNGSLRSLTTYNLQITLFVDHSHNNLMTFLYFANIESLDKICASHLFSCLSY